MSPKRKKKHQNRGETFLKTKTLYIILKDEIILHHHKQYKWNKDNKKKRCGN